MYRFSELIQKSSDRNIILSLTVLGLILRLYAFKFSYVINNDGVLYINQARALFLGDWELALNCGYKYISIYHLLIPVFYKVFGNWITAAKSVSLMFGTLTIIPCYLIARQFFSKPIAILAVLSFAVNPFFVSNSVELIKGPVFWFFALLGIFFFIMTRNSHDKDYLLLFSSISFLIAGLARVEILVYFTGTMLYIVFFSQRKAKSLFLFSLPAVIACASIPAGLSYYYDNFNLWTFYLKPRIHDFFPDLYVAIFNDEFIRKTVHAIGLLLSKTAKTVYLPFLPFLLFGIYAMKKELKENHNSGYLLFLSILSFLAIYTFYLKTEIISSRYTVLIVLPLYFFIGFGMKRLFHFSESRGLQEKTVFASILLYILVLGIANNLAPVRTDKLIYKEIGTYIAGLEQDQKVMVMAPDSRIMFYANLNSREIACTTRLGLYREYIHLDYQAFTSRLKKEKVDYFLWEEKSREDTNPDLFVQANPEHFRSLKQWDTGDNRYILFKILY
jgi:predicted membrane-bound mannosyltransferase